MIAVTVILALVAYRLVMRLDDRRGSDSYAVRLLARLAAAAIVITGFVFVLASLEINLTPLLAGLGIVGVVIAFATQDFIANYVAGILIGIRRPFRIGDEISSQGLEGRVEDLNLRYTTIRGFDGTRILLPNAEVFGSPLTNFTVNGNRRSEVSLEVAYDTDMDMAKELLQSVASECPGVAGNPAPVAQVKATGDSAVEIFLYFWHSPERSNERKVRDSVVVSTLLACRREGIEIPFPRREVELIGGPDEGKAEVSGDVDS